MAIGKLLEPLIGEVGFFLLIGIGLPCIMAAYYYALDLRTETSFAESDGQPAGRKLMLGQS
ncbi:MAG: hypothetical protein E5W87_17865 [Mesorhizobium sp.]|nr:MAG: hypothetical protein E5W87_17865 [Mesorhizobium sp.]